MNNMQVFKYENHEIRTVNIGDVPWWIGKDVADTLGYDQTSNMVKRLDAEDFKSSKLDGMNMKSTLINESGLYSAIIGSKLPSAKKFKRWVTHEVLPSIRKHGMYAGDELLNNPDLLLDVVKKLKEERDRRIKLESEAMTNKPKIVFADAVAAAQSSILIGELAKLLKQNGIEMGQNRLFIWMRNNGYLIKRKGTDYNMPTQHSMEKKLFTIKETSISHADGHISVSKTPKITGIGQQFFMNLFLQEKQIKVIE